MVGMKRLRRLAPLAVAVWAAVACDRPEYTYSKDAKVAGSPTSNAGGVTGVAGSNTGIAGSSAPPACELLRSVGSEPIFRHQSISNQLPVRDALYLQATDEEIAELQAGGPLIKAPVAGAPTSPLTSVLAALGNQVTNPERKKLLDELSKRFRVTRAAWPNPWALRLIDHAGAEHMTPVRLRFKESAWIARIIDQSPIVVNLDNAQVPLSDVLAAPERIAAVYYLIDDKLGGLGQSSACESARREFALGNEAMLESFEIGTEEIAQRMKEDLGLLNQLFAVARNCTTFDGGGSTFQANTACQAWDFFNPSTELSAYQWALSRPAELYKPTPQNLSSLVQALEDDEVALDPFVSEPHPLPLGEAGQGGAAGAGGADSSVAGVGGDAGFGQGGR
jgi:hypothetical protein